MVSVYCIGMNKIEIGRYSCNLDRAMILFEGKLIEYGCSFTKSLTPHIVEYNLKFGEKGVKDLLFAMADVDDLRGDPPFSYELVEIQEQKEVYVKTGSFYD